MATSTAQGQGQGQGGQKQKLINLIRGWPAPKLLPAAQLKAASARALSDPSVYVPGLQYGPDPGYQPLREALARYLAGYFDTTPDPERLCITGGASQSAACILQSFTDPAYTQAVWVVAPCYHLMCPIFEDAGFHGRLHAVPEDDEGIDLAALERGLRSFEGLGPSEPAYKRLTPDRKAYRHIIYAVPTCANPSGKTMTLARREGLVRLARRHDALVIADDVYDFLQWPVLSPSSPALSTAPEGEASPTPLARTRPLPRLVDIDLALGPPSEHDGKKKRWFGHAISNGSFSKIVGPGVRTGWVEGTPAFAFGLAQTGSTKSGGAPSQLSAALVCELLASGALDAHLHAAVRPALQRRHSRMLAAIREELAGFIVEGESTATFGGYFIWLTLRPGYDAREVARRALAAENLIVAPGAMFQVAGDEAAARFDRNVRLCYSWEDEDDVVEGVRRLGRVLRAYGEPLAAAGEGGGEGGLAAYK